MEQLESNADDNNSQATLKHNILNFAGYTTAHGIGRLSSSQGLLSRISWAVILLATYGGFVYHMSSLINRFTSKPLITSISRTKFEYPDVYICPSKAYSLSRVHQKFDDLFVYPQFTMALNEIGKTRDWIGLDYYIKVSLLEASDIKLYTRTNYNVLTAKKTPLPTISKLEKLIKDNALTLEENTIKNDKLAAFNEHEQSFEDLLMSATVDGASTETCRYSLKGTEYNGTESTAFRLFDNNGTLVARTCLTWAKGIEILRNTSTNSSLPMKIENEFLSRGIPISQRFCKGLNSVTVSEVQFALSQTFLKVEDLNTLRYNSGPMCFHMEEDNLTLSHCGIPFCESPINCRLSDIRGGLLRYTGPQNETKVRRTCVPFDTIGSNGIPVFHDVILPDVPRRLDVCRATRHLRYAGVTKGMPLSYNTNKTVCVTQKVENSPAADPSKVYGAGDCEILPCSENLNKNMLTDVIGRPSILSNIGHTAALSFLSCSVDDLECTHSDFQEFIHPNFGVCFKFNPTTDEMLAKLRDKGELKLILFTDMDYTVDPMFDKDEKYLEAVSDALRGTPCEDKSFKLILTSGQFPFSKEALELYPEERTVVRIGMQKETAFDKRPDRPCEPENSVIYAVDVKDNSTSPFLRRNLKFKADEDSCRNDFIVRKFTEICGCLPSDYPIGNQWATSELPLCYNETSNSNLFTKRYLCVKNLRSRLNTLKQQSNCHRSCKRTQYSTKLRSRPWMSEISKETLETFRTILDQLGFWSNFTGQSGLQLAITRIIEDKTISATEKLAFLQTIRKSILSVKLQPGYESSQNVVEEEAYPLKNLMADFGGILGLWCGVSVLTIMEIVELCVLIMTAIAVKCDAKKSGKVDPLKPKTINVSEFASETKK